jgi:hypothetical protein
MQKRKEKVDRKFEVRKKSCQLASNVNTRVPEKATRERVICIN